MANTVSIEVSEDLYRETLERRTPRQVQALVNAVLRWENENTDPRANQSIRTTEERAQRAYVIARRRVMSSGGEWVRGQELRPEYRDRDLLGDSVWEKLEEDPEIETEETPHGTRVRRRARYVPLV